MANSLIIMTSLQQGKIRMRIFVFFALCIPVLTAANVRADLTPKQTRKSITRMAGFALTNGSVRVKSVSQTSATTAEASAEIRFVFKFEKDRNGSWLVTEIRTGQDRWEEVSLIANALKTPLVTGECTAPDPPLKGSAAIDPSVKRARCLLGSLLRVQVPSDALRIQEVAPFTVPVASQPSAVVVAWVKADARLMNGKNGWQVTELRTGNNDWVSLEPLVTSLNGEKQKKARSELERIAKALELFRRDRGGYVVSDKQAVVIDYLNPRYLGEVIRVDPWHQPYIYQGERDHFTLRSAGPDGKENTPDDILLSDTLR